MGRCARAFYHHFHGCGSVSAFCDVGHAALANGSSPLETLGIVLASLSEQCLESNYSAYMGALLDTNFSTGTPTNRQWYYQLCNEFGQQRSVLTLRSTAQRTTA